MQPQNRIDTAFAELARTGGKALMPYLTAGYPNLEATTQMVSQFARLGVPVVELGVPFSDSIADGPIIQGSFHRVLAGGFRIENFFTRIREMRPDLNLALLAMVSVSIVRRITLTKFVERCRDCGFDGLIVPDLPVDEASELASAAAKAGLKNVLLVAPTTPASRRVDIARMSTGFVYQIAVRGITGERNRLSPDVVENVCALRQVSGLPVCVGFGISRPDHVRAVCQAADGAIVGSALVRRITEGLDAGLSGPQIVSAISSFVAELLEGTKVA
jgi:tryptophan synthase alpha chain